MPRGFMSQTLKRDIFKIPNLLSLFRILLIPVFVYVYLFVTENILISFGILVVSFITDVADGYIARKYHMVTELGKVLDPLADKATQTAIIFLMWQKHYVSVFIFAIIFTKECIMGLGALYLKKFIKSSIIPANKWGKTATGGFYFSVALILLGVPHNIGIICLNITVVIMIVAFISYLKIFLKVRKEQQLQKNNKVVESGSPPKDSSQKNGIGIKNN
jgi:cardiolipin synthase